MLSSLGALDGGGVDEFLLKPHVGFLELLVNLWRAGLIPAINKWECSWQNAPARYFDAVSTALWSIYSLIFLCSASVWKFFCSLQPCQRAEGRCRMQPADFAPLAPTIPAGSCGCNTFPKCAQSKARDWAGTAGAGVGED